MPLSLQRSLEPYQQCLGGYAAVLQSDSQRHSFQYRPQHLDVASTILTEFFLSYTLTSTARIVCGAPNGFGALAERIERQDKRFRSNSHVDAQSGRISYRTNSYIARVGGNREDDTSLGDVSRRRQI